MTIRWSCQPPGGLVETQPRSTIGPGWVVVTVIVTVALAPAASEPRLHSTVGLPLQLPWLGAVSYTHLTLPTICSV